MTSHKTFELMFVLTEVNRHALSEDKCAEVVGCVSEPRFKGHCFTSAGQDNAHCDPRNIAVRSFPFLTGCSGNLSLPWLADIPFGQMKCLRGHEA